jgi:colicin import membrane protein
MSSMALDPAGWRPPRAERFGLGATFSLLAHAGLIVALALGLHWRNEAPPVVVSAELWSAVPQIAAPAATAEPAPAPTPTPPRPEARPEPTPPPPAQAQRDAEIAIERARIEKRKAEEAAERQKAKEAAERLKAQKLAEAKAREAKAAEDKRQQELQQARAAQAEAQRVARTREENLKRMLAQAGGAATAEGTPGGTAARDAGPSASYAGRIKARIKPNIKLLTEVGANPITEVEVRCAPDGEIIGRRIVKPSGNPAWDETVLRAIDITRVLPRDIDGRIPATMTLVFSLKDL